MKLFLKSNLPFILFTLILQGLSAGVYWLDDYRNVSLFLYSLFLSAVLLAVFLCTRYYAHRHLFRRLSRQQKADIDSAFFPMEGAPLNRALENYLSHQYHLYQQRLHKLAADNHERAIFMNQWVHQMKTPVSVINLMTQENKDPALRSIQEETEKIKNGLNTVLYTLRLDHFETDFVVGTFDVLGLVKETVNECKRLFISHKLYPKVEIADGLMIETDKKWFQFALTQLITNAIKYTPAPGSKIMITGKIKESLLLLRVSDKGIGIEPADLPRVFRPFFTGENGRKYSQSTGMGLYLTKKICENLGYGLGIVSKLNHGTDMTIKIPYNPSDSSSLTKL